MAPHQGGFADYAVPALANVFSSALVAGAVVYVTEYEVLVALGVLLTLVVYAATTAANAWFLADARIDAFERFWLYVLAFLLWLFYFFTLQVALVLASSVASAWPAPLLSEYLLYVALLIVFALAFMPHFAQLVDVPRAKAA